MIISETSNNKEMGQ